MQEEPTAAGPVFVDGTGRRAQLVGRVGAAVALVALGYGVTLVVLAIVGVHVDAPGLPLVEHAARPLTGHGGQGGQEQAAPIPPTTSATDLATPPSATPSAAASASASAAAAPGQGVHPTPSGAPTSRGPAPSSSASAAPGNGKSSSAPGATNRATPTTRPTSHPTSSGKATSAPGQTHRPPR